METEIGGRWRIFDGTGGSATVSLQLHIVYSFSSHHLQGEPWNFPMKAATPSF